MTTVTFDVSYGTRAVPLRLPYLSVRRRRAALSRPAPAGATDPRTTARARATARALADREAAVDRALTLRAGIGV
ncbi:hypothetical protein MHY85_11110 [Cellulomonas sp. ACRRI]|uniref:hypothetical protein n=1 Tax=Cellulomonas sp. ACRRI TaxID=2918188 RepID=UPI001EF22FE9|nr:hypothetical protein [Cellulomonas sp. ACRRI]MCG7286517.1 hypothetical protein [Cellulomonas sp. ACRRI]